MKSKQSEIEKLEQENERMALRLQNFKLKIEAQAKNRGNGIWKSAAPKQGSLHNYGPEILFKRPRKEKIFGNVVIEVEKVLGLSHKKTIKESPNNHSPAPPKFAKPPLPTTRNRALKMWVAPKTPAPEDSECNNPLLNEEFNEIHRDPNERKKYVSDSQPIGTLLEGEFDEAAGHASFLEALNQWRAQENKSERNSEIVDSDKNKILNDTIECSKKLSDSLPVNSLLEGEFDEAAGHASFLEALRNWRGEENKPETNSIASQQTQNSETASYLNFDFPKALSYFDQLILMNKKQFEENTSIIEPPLPPVVQECDVTRNNSNPDHAWTEEDESALSELLSKLENKNLLEESEPKSMDVEIQDEQLKIEITMEDLTENEDEYILDALNNGRIIECIPSSKLLIIES